MEDLWIESAMRQLDSLYAMRSNVENLRSVHCSPSVFSSKVLASRKTNLITARARKNKCFARMLVNARKDHSLSLMSLIDISFSRELMGDLGYDSSSYKRRSCCCC